MDQGDSTSATRTDGDCLLGICCLLWGSHACGGNADVVVGIPAIKNSFAHLDDEILVIGDDSEDTDSDDASLPLLLTNSETEHEAGTDDGATDNETDNESGDEQLHRFLTLGHVQFRREEQQQRGPVHLHALVD